MEGILTSGRWHSRLQKGGREVEVKILLPPSESLMHRGVSGDLVEVEVNFILLFYYFVLGTMYIQEAIENTLKHTEATLIATGMKRDDRHLTITLSDNDHPLKQMPSGNAIGLRTVQLRAKAINYHLNYITIRFGNTLMLDGL